MKKTLIISSFALSLVAFFAFTTPKDTYSDNNNSVAISVSETITVNVVRITTVGRAGATSTASGYTGKYDTETGYITIYQNGKQVAYGKPQINYADKGSRSKYNCHLNGTYYFNLYL